MRDQPSEVSDSQNWVPIPDIHQWSRLAAGLRQLDDCLFQIVFIEGIKIDWIIPANRKSRNAERPVLLHVLEHPALNILRHF